jgi:ParB family chromosome partitioning protein
MQEQIQDVRITLIDPGDNDRQDFDTESLQELAASIKQHGLAQPITLRPVGERFQIVAGERRWRAFGLLERETIPALVRTLSDQQASSIMLLENVQRNELNPIEEARAYQKRMDKFDWNAKQVAKIANVSPQRVRLRLALLDTVPEAQKLVKDGQMGIKYAYALRDLDTNRQRIALRYLAEVDTPRLKEFRKLCARLLEEQAQEAMFDMATFMTKVQDVRDAEEEARPDRVIPVDDELPAMRKARSVASAMERYIKDLVDAGEDQAAKVAGTIYRGLLQHKIVSFPNGPSPLIPGECPYQ